MNIKFDSILNKLREQDTSVGGGQVNTVVAGSNITVDSTDAANPIIKLTTMATKTYKGRTSASTGVVEDVGVATLKTDLGLVKGDVGLGNVDNTTDVGKPVSTAQQTALDLKSNIASPTFTGTVSGITASMVGAPTGSGTSTGSNTGDNTNFAPPLGVDDNYVTDAEKVIIGNTSGTNTGDNATNTQYSGLNSSKQDTLVSTTNIKSINGSSILGSGDLVVSGSLPNSIITKNILGADTTITAGYSSYIPYFLEISDGFTVECGDLSILEIG